MEKCEQGKSGEREKGGGGGGTESTASFLNQAQSLVNRRHTYIGTFSFSDTFFGPLRGKKERASTAMILGKPIFETLS